MSPESLLRLARTPVDAGRQVAQLRHVSSLVEQMAERPTPAYSDEAALDESAQVSAAYERALPIVQRRFDTLACETVAWSAAGVEALLAASGTARPVAAARRLGDELARALRDLGRLIGA